jgi:hypothetical protein
MDWLVTSDPISDVLFAAPRCRDLRPIGRPAPVQLVHAGVQLELSPLALKDEPGQGKGVPSL